jgi:hypothetical protein
MALRTVSKRQKRREVIRSRSSRVHLMWTAALVADGGQTNSATGLNLAVRRRIHRN